MNLCDFTYNASKLICRGNYYVYINKQNTFIYLTYLDDLFSNKNIYRVPLNNDCITYLIYSHPFMNNNKETTDKMILFYNHFKEVYIFDILYYMMYKVIILSNIDNFNQCPIPTYRII